MNNLTNELRFDLPTLHRMTVGFDRLFEEMQSHGYRNSVTTSPNQGYPHIMLREYQTTNGK